MWNASQIGRSIRKKQRRERNKIEELTNEFQEEAKRWQPPKLSDIKYSRISKEHLDYLEREKRGKRRNGKKAESRATSSNRRTQAQEGKRQSSVGGAHDGRANKRRAGRRAKR